MKAILKKHQLKESPLHKLGNHRRLAALLRIDNRSLAKLARLGPAGYSEWDDVSPKGKVRRIENPKPRLKKAQARIATLLGLIEPPGFLSCPVKGRSYVTNARHHVGAKEIVTLDIKAYFPSTTWKRVYWFFNKRLMMPADTAWTLSSLATVNQRLPTGSPLSPVLAYYAHEDMWLAVAKIAQESDCRLTVYMDDVTISGEHVPEALIWRIKQEIHKTGLRLNDRKERRFSDGEGVVTGVVVTRTGMRLPKQSYLKLSEARKSSASERDPRAKTKLLNRVRGMESQHAQVLKA